MGLSIILPSYESSATLERSLRSVENAKLAIEKEVIVVDSSPEPVSDELTSKFKKIKFIQQPTRLYAGAARNLGAKQAKYDLLCFLDSDCVWNDSWASALNRHLGEKTKWDALTGAIFYERPAKSWDFALHLMEFHEYLATTGLSVRFLPSGNFVIHRSFFEKIGGFREDLPMCEDISFASHLESDYLSKLVFDPKLSISHLAHLVDKDEIFKKTEKMGYWRAAVESQLPNRMRLSQRPWFVLANHFLGTVFFLGILLRSLRHKSAYLKAIFLYAPMIHRLCNLWAKGFQKGLAISDSELAFEKPGQE